MDIRKRKQIDLLVQIAAIVLPWLYYLLFSDGNRLLYLEHLMVAYSLIGVVQIASCVVNRARLPRNFRAGSRGWFESIVVFLTGAVVISLFMKSLLLSLMLLLYSVPILVIWYLGITIYELVRMRDGNTAGD